MPADASIYSMIQPLQRGPGPLELAGQGLQIRNMLDQGQLSQLQRQQLESQMAEDAAVKSAFSGMQPGQTIKDILPQVLQASPKTGVQMNKAVTEQEAAAASLEKTKADTFRLNMQQLRDQVASVQNDTDLARLRETSLRLLGPQAVSDMPQSVSDPNFAQWQKQKVMTGDEFLARIAPKPPAGHTVMPGGGLSPIDPNYLKGQEAIRSAGRPQVTTNILPPQKTFENEDKLRSDYTANPVVKASSEMATAFGMIEAAYKRPSAANDLAMATKYMKILDPTSVVRESEFALAVNATGLLDKVQNYAASVLEGKKLNPAQRKDFYDSAKAINEAFQKQRAEVDKQYSEMATGYGLNPKNVIPSLRASPKPAAPKPPAPVPSKRPSLDHIFGKPSG